jgi:prepilin-type N-terminal cleavage/methylation domain-containing protein
MLTMAQPTIGRPLPAGEVKGERMVDAASHERGFSLIELLVAMAITLIVSGAIYGLLAGGQNAFRREPELTERQQNIRMAMDVIMRDIGNAGVGLPPFVQVFKEGLNACAGCPMGPNNVTTDELEIISSGGQDSEPVCADPGNSSQVIVLTRANVNIPVGSIIVLTTSDGYWTTREVTAVSNTSTATGNCTSGSHTRINISQGASVSGLNVAGGPCQPAGLPGFGNVTSAAGCTITTMNFSEIIRYRIRPDADGVPSLQRFTSARWGDGYQTIARGIEDLQVQYAAVNAPTTWVDSAPIVASPPPAAPPAPPPAPDPNNYGTLTRQVRVTLASRSEAKKIQGAQTALSGPAALRGSLTSTGSPRSALIHVVQGRPASPAAIPAWSWQ